MASSASSSFQQTCSNTTEDQGKRSEWTHFDVREPDFRTASQRPEQPPGYNALNTNGSVVTTHQGQLQVLQPYSGGPAVVVTQPVVTVLEPQTMCALFMSGLSTIFFCFICGITGVLLAWKARLYVLEHKLEQARLTVNIVWVFFGLAIFFGIITWTLVGIYIIRPRVIYPYYY